MLLDEGFRSAGAVRLPGADIARNLACSSAHLNGEDDEGVTLRAGGIKVSSIYLDDGFTTSGTVWLESANIRASAHVAPASGAMGLVAAHAQIAGTLNWIPTAQIEGTVNLQGAATGQLVDDWSSGRNNAFWPTKGRLSLDGFTYSRVGGAKPATVKQRLDWIRSQFQSNSGSPPTPFATQPYEQLAAVYRQAGQDAEARKVAIAKRTDLRDYGNLTLYRQWGNWLLDKTIKYGYQAWRAGVGLAAVFIAFVALSYFAQHHNLMVPVANTQGLHSLPSAAHCTSNYPCFYPVGYAVDTVVPLIDVHQAEYWGPNGHAPWGWIWVAGTWIATGLGWALATLLVAGYTGLVRQT